MSINISNRTACLSGCAILLLAVAVPAAHAARTFCCTDDKNQQRCGDVLPEACRDRAYAEYNEAGIRVRSVARPLTEAEQAAKDIEDRKKRDIAEAAQKQQRADQALLSTYSDEKDLDTARDRAVSELQRSIKSAEEKLADLNKNKAKLMSDTEFYKNKSLPPDLKQKIARNDSALLEQQTTIADKKKEIEETEAKFDGFRKRLLELKAKDKADRL